MWWDKALHEGPTDALYLRKCHWIMDDENWKQLKLVFFFMPHHSDFWVMNHQNRVTKTEWWSPNNIFFVGPTNFGWWVMSFGSYHPKHPSSKQHLIDLKDLNLWVWAQQCYINHSPFSLQCGTSLTHIYPTIFSSRVSLSLCRSWISPTSSPSCLGGFFYHHHVVWHLWEPCMNPTRSLMRTSMYIPVY